jgi:hypothetical protein
MTDVNKVPEVTLMDAAARLAASYNQTLRLVLVGKLAGERRNGRWYVDADDLERLRAERHS